MGYDNLKILLKSRDFQEQAGIREEECFKFTTERGLNLYEKATLRLYGNHNCLFFTPSPFTLRLT